VVRTEADRQAAGEATIPWAYFEGQRCTRDRGNPEQYQNVADENPDVVATHRRELLDRVTTIDIASERDRDWWY
jgi:hypothetical protein